MQIVVSLVAILLLATAPVVADIHGRIVSVADGDSLTLIDSKGERHRIRLADIDAPELGQPFANASRQHLSDRCLRRTAVVRNPRPDSHGRTLGHVRCSGVDVNAELVGLGLAWVYSHFAPADSPLHALQDAARGAGRGLWSENDPLAPWDYRRQRREAPATSSASSVPGSTEVRGNRNSMIYHLPHCASYDAVSPRNRVSFHSEVQARRAGYRRARNCRPGSAQE